eukprot:95131-Rhodomonas_salina.2
MSLEPSPAKTAAPYAPQQYFAVPQQAAVYVPNGYSGMPAQQMQCVPTGTTSSAFPYTVIQNAPLTSTSSQWGMQPQYLSTAGPLAGTQAQAALQQSRNELVDLRKQVQDLQLSSQNLSPRATDIGVYPPAASCRSEFSVPSISGYPPSPSTADSYPAFLRRRGSTDGMYTGYPLSSMSATSDRFQGSSPCCLGCGGPID